MPRFVDEKRRAEIAKLRGKVAQFIDDPQKRKEFIQRQAEIEERQGGLDEESAVALTVEAKRVSDRAAAGVPGFSLKENRRRE